MERKDLVMIGEKILADFIAAPPQDNRTRVIRMTSGTTGGEPLVIISQPPKAAGWFLAAERILVCYGSLNARLNNILPYRRNSASSNVRVFPIEINDMREPLSSLGDIVADFKPDRIIGVPSFIMRLAAILDADTRSGVKMLRLAGEMISARQKQSLIAWFPKATVSAIYVATEIGPISKPTCAHVPLNHYHVRDGVTVEISEPDDNGVGDILVSTTISETMSIEKYRVGDVGRIHTTPCPCGAAETIELLGRRGSDYLKLAGALLRQEEFNRVSLLFPNSIDDYRAEAREVIQGTTPKGKVTLRIYSSRGSGTEELAREIGTRFSRELFVTPTQTLSELVKKGIFLPMEVIFEQHPFPQKNKEVKLLHIVS